MKQGVLKSPQRRDWQAAWPGALLSPHPQTLLQSRRAASSEGCATGAQLHAK